MKSFGEPATRQLDGVRMKRGNGKKVLDGTRALALTVRTNGWIAYLLTIKCIT
jgi:hypothetical protein